MALLARPASMTAVTPAAAAASRLRRFRQNGILDMIILRGWCASYNTQEKMIDANQIGQSSVRVRVPYIRMVYVPLARMSALPAAGRIRIDVVAVLIVSRPGPTLLAAADIGDRVAHLG